jgi:hypothetical protein
MAEMRLEADHARERRDRFLFHGRTRAAAVQRMVVGIEFHGERIGQARHRVRRLEHLPDVERMLIGEIVAEPIRRRCEHFTHTCEVECRVGLG